MSDSTFHQIRVGDKIINFSIQIRKGMKHTYISIDKTGNVIVKSRKISYAYARELVLEKSEWIIKKSQEIKRREEKVRQVREKNFDSFSTIKLFGENYQVCLIEDNSYNGVKISFDGLIFFITVHPDIADKNKIIKDCLDEFYRKKSNEYITPLVKKWSEIMQLYPKEVKFRKVKKRWGSCSYDNKISLSLNIAQLKEEQASYIIVHELSHIKEKNHSKNFWNLVESYFPDYKRVHKETLDCIV